MYLALEAGLCPESAFRFAAADQSVDEGNTEPLNSYLENWWKKPEELREAMQPHFPIDPEISSKDPSASVEQNSNYVNKLMSDAFQSGSLETVGRNIHTYQDSWSHQGYINQHGIPALTYPDDTSILERWRGRDLDMARHTYYELLILVDIKNNFKKDFDFCICEDPKPFPEDFVKRYLKVSSMKQKKEMLQQSEYQIFTNKI